MDIFTTLFFKELVIIFFKPKSKTCFFLLCENFYACYILLMALSMFVQLIGPEPGFITGVAGKAIRFLLCASSSGSLV